MKVPIQVFYAFQIQYDGMATSINIKTSDQDTRPKITDNCWKSISGGF